MERLILHEDEHLLAINKPAGMNTHSPSLFAGEGIYEWLKNREPRWSNLAIIHRLDKETSGVIAFAKTPLASRSLTQQFEKRLVKKKYLLLTDRKVEFQNLVAKSSLVRAGEKYLSRPLHAGGEVAETLFQNPKQVSSLEATLVEAEPLTGRTHQIRVHAAEHGFPILGDVLYGGTSAARVFLHAHELSLRHPETEKEITFTAPPDFDRDPRFELRNRLISASETNAFRLRHGSADGFAGWYVDQFGEFLLSQSEKPLDDSRKILLEAWLKLRSLRGVYHKTLSRHVRGASTRETSPSLILGESSPDEIIMRENGVQFAIRFQEGYSVGLFLDQRDNRRRLLTNYIAPDFFLPRAAQHSVLNAFAYTCGFSVCAAKAGARVTSLDLSKKYLEWGKRNFALNDLNPADHDFIFGDVFDWLRRFARKGRTFDVVLLDPPTFSQSKEHGVFRAEKDYGKLVELALSVLKPGGILFGSTNAAELKPEKFLETISIAARAQHRSILKMHYAPQPPDFPISRDEPAYLKTVWLQMS